MNENEFSQLNQRVENLEKEISEIRGELDKKQDKPDLVKKYISWIVIGVIVVIFYASYYYYITSLF